MISIYCLGQRQAISRYCCMCQHTPQEYIECPHFTAMARHEIVVENLEAREDDLETRLNRNGSIMGLGEVEE